LERDAAGRLLRIQGGADQTDHGDEESLVYVEFSAPAGFDGEALAASIRSSLDDLAVVVGDYQPMRAQLTAVAESLDAATGADAAERGAVQAFLRWLDSHFTMLGYRRRSVEEGAAAGDESMLDVAGSSLGLLREDRPGIDPDGYVAPAAEMDKYAQSSRILVVAKANARAWIHHPEPMDVITVKELDADANVTGAHRFLGLFSSDA